MISDLKIDMLYMIDVDVICRLPDALRHNSVLSRNLVAFFKR